MAYEVMLLTALKFGNCTASEQFDMVVKIAIILEKTTLKQFQREIEMKRQKIACSGKKKRYSGQSEYKRAVKEALRVKAMRRLNKELQTI